MDRPISDVILVSYDHNPTKGNTVLIVGRRRFNGTTDIINAFSGDEAKAIYEKLTKVVE